MYFLCTTKLLQNGPFIQKLIKNITENRKLLLQFCHNECHHRITVFDVEFYQRYLFLFIQLSPNELKADKMKCMNALKSEIKTSKINKGKHI